MVGVVVIAVIELILVNIVDTDDVGVNVFVVCLSRHPPLSCCCIYGPGGNC